MQSEQSEQSEHAQPAVESTAATAQAAQPEPAPPLPDSVEAGEISRSALFAVLQAGAGRFLQHLDVEPHLEGGRFIGWRLRSLFASSQTFKSDVVRAGDTVMRVNGQSIERPEQFQNVWDNLATASDLVLLVRRGGKESTVRYRIVESKSP